MNYQFIIGIDISKHSFDVAIFSANNAENVYHKSFTNDESGFEALLKFTNEAVTGFNIAESLFATVGTHLTTAPPPSVCRLLSTAEARRCW